MTKFFSRTALVVIALYAGSISPASAAEPASTPIVVYDTALAADWQNWSWAKTELSVELSGSARRPISVEAAGWQALYLHHDSLDTAGRKQVSLLIQGTQPGNEMRLFALIGGKPASEGHLTKFGNTGWTHVVVPLATLGAEDKVIDGLWVQNASGNDLPKVFVTEIRIE